MLSPITPVCRPCKLTFRFAAGSHPNFKLPYAGMWAITAIGGGGGSGATHTSYADPSEHGGNGQVINSGYSFRRALTATIEPGAGGVGGTLTNDSDVTAQRGKVGAVTQYGFGTRTGGAFGRCAYEATGLDPTQPAATYPASTYDNRSISWSISFGVQHSSGSTSSTAGQGAAGKTVSGQAGSAGNNGRVDYFFYG